MKLETYLNWIFSIIIILIISTFIFCIVSYYVYSIDKYTIKIETKCYDRYGSEIKELTCEEDYNCPGWIIKNHPILTNEEVLRKCKR